jgi:pimeloyl-ACP methyl ester carboxylesterase
MVIDHQSTGAGPPVILIHGFPMNAAVWSAFAPLLSSDYTIITPDLPGFGKSASLPTPFSLSDIGEAMNSFVENNRLSGATLIGHSLGGYVALAMISKRPELFNALGLFHSTALPDSADKKASRFKVVEFVEKNGAEAFTSNFIGPLFADPQHGAIELVKQIAIGSSSATVIGYTLAMRDRDDHTATLKTLNNPVLFICGDKDGGIPVDTITQQAALCADPTVRVLSDVAHMGMFEDPKHVASIMRDFLTKM